MLITVSVRRTPTERFFSKDAVFTPSLVILKDADGLYPLPDNVMMQVTLTSTKDENWLLKELYKLLVFLKELCTTHRIQHLALAFSKDNPDHPATDHPADVTCIRLY